MLSPPSLLVQAQRVDSHARDAFGGWVIRLLIAGSPSSSNLEQESSVWKISFRSPTSIARPMLLFWKTNLMCGASLGANVYQRHDTYVDIEFLPGRVIG